jgi:hypothetical protein
MLICRCCFEYRLDVRCEPVSPARRLFEWRVHTLITFRGLTRMIESGIVGSLAPANYKSDSTSQLASKLTKAVESDVASEVGGVWLVTKLVSSAGGGGGEGKPLPGVSPAQQTAAVERISREIPTSRPNFLICVVPSYMGNRRSGSPAIAVVN